MGSLKDSYSNLKSKMKSHMEDYQTSLKKLESEKSNLLSNISQLSQQRKAFNRLHLELQCCQDLSQCIVSEACDSEIESAVKEMNYWKSLISCVGEEMKATQQSIARIPELETEIE